MSADPLVKLIYPLLTYGDIPTEEDAEAIAAVIRLHYRVFPEAEVTQEIRTRSFKGWCEHRFVVHHPTEDPTCP